jgi:hypothetical protein
LKIYVGLFMKKSLCFVILLCVFSVAVFADDKPKSAADKPIIYLNTNAGTLPSFTGNLSKLAADLRAEGYTLQEGPLDYDDITDEFLSGIDVLFLIDPKTPLLEDSKAALRRFLRNGGALLIMVWQFWYGEKSNLNSFTMDFGLWYGYDRSYDTYAKVLPASPLSKPSKCDAIGSKEIGRVQVVINTKYAQVVAREEKQFNDIFVALSISKNLGKGRLVIIGYDMLFYDTWIETYDNRAFAKNLFRYLAGGGADLKVMLSKITGTNLSAGSAANIIGKVKNISATESESTSLSFILSDSNTYPVRPSANTAVLKTVTIGALNPNKKIKVKTTAKIPSWILPDDYYLIVVVDPENETGDTDTSNNYKAGKKSVHIY